MTEYSKRRTQQHIIDTEAQLMFQAAIPKSWVTHEYRPDYGIDFAIEVFREVSPTAEKTPTFETMGEHLFVQLKGCQKVPRHVMTIRGRYNVEKAVSQSDNEEVVGEMEVLSLPLEVSELLTVQRMGAALPVLLVVADLSEQRCHFVCLNDYIDKVLVPKYDDYSSAKSRTIHVPSQNVLGDSDIGLAALKWYSKRPKLFAAFQKFVYQEAEINYSRDFNEMESLARHFASLLMRYDFWNDTDMWLPITQYGAAIRRFSETGRAGLVHFNEDFKRFVGDDLEKEQLWREIFSRQEIPALWRSLATLPRNYEELCREWFLPTPVGLLTSY